MRIYYNNDGKLLDNDNDGKQYVSIQYFLDLLYVSVDMVVWGSTKTFTNSCLGKGGGVGWGVHVVLQ